MVESVLSYIRYFGVRGRIEMASGGFGFGWTTFEFDETCGLDRVSEVDYSPFDPRYGTPASGVK